MTVNYYRAEFVQRIPPNREPDVLYVSRKYGTAVHSCACGCGNKVVTPLNPAGWRLTVAGSEVTLFPSVGNWWFPCRSHYFIEKGAVRWSTDWSADHVARGALRDHADRQRYFATRTLSGRLRDAISKILGWIRLR
ncbi:hypothetical protein J7E29_00060 [Streptomyces sp. ISL-90]|nr:hypothetical protein [Streptomyces sp. ISL-90]